MKVKDVKAAGAIDQAYKKMLSRVNIGLKPYYTVINGEINSKKSDIVIGGTCKSLIGPDGALLVKFGTVGSFDIDGHLLGLRTFRGFPTRIVSDGSWGWSLLIGTTKGVGPTKPDFLPVYMNGGIDLSIANSLESLSGMHTLIKDGMNGEICLPPHQLGGLLSLLLVKGLTRILTPKAGAQTIVNLHLAGMGGKRDVLACQEELIDAGFDEAATL